MDVTKEMLNIRKQIIELEKKAIIVGIPRKTILEVLKDCKHWLSAYIDVYKPPYQNE